MGLTKGTFVTVGQTGAKFVRLGQRRGKVCLSGSKGGQLIYWGKTEDTNVRVGQTIGVYALSGFQTVVQHQIDNTMGLTHIFCSRKIHSIQKSARRKQRYIYC